jgi:hypothetical protein
MIRINNNFIMNTLASKWECHVKCHDLNLEIATKAKAWKGAGWECNLGVTFTLQKAWKGVRKWTHTFPNGIPNFHKIILGGQNSLDWKFPYTIGKLLKRRCLKWAWPIWVLITQVMAGRNVKSQIGTLIPEISLCRSVWIVDWLVIRPSPHPKAPTCSSYPQSIAS